MHHIQVEKSGAKGTTLLQPSPDRDWSCEDRAQLGLVSGNIVVGVLENIDKTSGEPNAG